MRFGRHKTRMDFGPLGRADGMDLPHARAPFLWRAAGLRRRGKGAVAVATALCPVPSWRTRAKGTLRTGGPSSVPAPFCFVASFVVNFVDWSRWMREGMHGAAWEVAPGACPFASRQSSRQSLRQSSNFKSLVSNVKRSCRRKSAPILLAPSPPGFYATHIGGTFMRCWGFNWGSRARPAAKHLDACSFRLLTGSGIGAIIVYRNTPVSFGEGARSRSERIGSCFWEASA